MKLILRDRNQEMADAWKAVFRDTPDVEIGCGDIFDVTADAIVSPANSFGFMNGGIDAVYTKKFGQKLQEDLQRVLATAHYGELLVGEAVKVPIDNQPYRWLISAPTMRVPMDINGTVNAFLAMRAILTCVKRHNVTWPGPDQINSVLCPGLGTAIGRLPYPIAAYQMREAYRVVWEHQPLQFEDIGDSYSHHEFLRRGMPGILGYSGIHEKTQTKN